VAFINDHRDAFGVESICRVVPIAPSTYYRHRAGQRDPTKRSARAVRDEVLKAIIQRIWREDDQAYGSRKVWKQMGREGMHEARCRVRRLMRDLGLVGASSGDTRGPPRRGPTPPPTARRTWSIGTLSRPGRISCGCRISRTSPRGPASSMWPS
jgi:transposase InsO family protein